MRRPVIALLVLAYAAFVSLGLPDTVLGVAWPALRAEWGLSQASLGLATAAGVAGYFVSGALAGRVAAALGVGALLAGSCALVAAGLGAVSLAPSFGLFAAGGAVWGLGSGAVDAALNGYAAKHFPVRHVNWLHACYGVGASAGPAVMTAVLAGGGTWRRGYALVALALAGMALAFVATRRRWDEPAGAAAPGGDDPGALAALRLPAVRLQALLFFVYTGLESASGQWAFSVLRARGLDVAAAGSWTAAYWASLALGRFALGFAVERVGPDRLVRLATLGALAGSAAFALLPGLAARLGLALVAASLAPVFPTLMARTPARVGPAAQHAIGFQVAAATLGVAVFPGAFGLLAGRSGLEAIGAAMLATAALLGALHEALLARHV